MSCQLEDPDYAKHLHNAEQPEELANPPDLLVTGHVPAGGLLSFLLLPRQDHSSAEMYIALFLFVFDKDLI